MFFSDPFINHDPGDGGGRARARLVLQIITAVTALGMWLGLRHLPAEAIEPFGLLGVAVMVVCLVVSYVL